MGFEADETEWDAFLREWPLERLKTMALEDYSKVGSRNTFTYWMEGRLAEYGSIWGGSSFKFGIYARNDTQKKESGAQRIYTDDYAWYRKFGADRQSAFLAVREQVAFVAERAASGDFSVLDRSGPVPQLGSAYCCKIAFHYQNRTNPALVCVFTISRLRQFLGLPVNDRTELSQLYRMVAKQRPSDQPIVAFSKHVWKTAVASEPYRVALTPGAINNGYLQFGDVEWTPFPESMRGGPTDEEAGDTAKFVTDSGIEFESDIRVTEGNSGRLRSRLGKYFSDVGAKVGSLIQVDALEDGSYRISHRLKDSKLTADTSLLLGSETIEPGRTAMIRNIQLNQILYGPPGTGKTYATVDKAIEILEPDLASAPRREKKSRFDEFVKQGRIRFVTFHQSFSYEDFVEGIRASSDNDGRLHYKVEPGIFKQMCEAARGVDKVADTLGIKEDPTIWKLSIDGTGKSNTRDYCLSHEEARIGWGDTGDLTSADLASNAFYQSRGSNDHSTLRSFSKLAEEGDVLLCIGSSDTFQAIGVVTGPYRFEGAPPKGVDPGYKHVLPVHWLKTGLEVEIADINRGKGFTQKTMYECRFGWPDLLGHIERNGILLSARDEASRTDDGLGRRPYVLIIDEINRGNASRIFGELITLIEPSKREGAEESLSVELPYSKLPFSIPQNLHIVGTMNTADRSLSGLDVALRRRFVFDELVPQPALLDSIQISDISVGSMLRTVNARIEALLGRDFMLGHAYFLKLDQDRSFESLRNIFRREILPLLQEYFFEDWEKIALVLNDPAKELRFRFLVPPQNDLEKLFGRNDIAGAHGRWGLNEAAFGFARSYIGIYADPPADDAI